MPLAPPAPDSLPPAPPPCPAPPDPIAPALPSVPAIPVAPPLPPPPVIAPPPPVPPPPPAPFEPAPQPNAVRAASARATNNDRNRIVQTIGHVRIRLLTKPAVGPDEDARAPQRHFLFKKARRRAVAFTQASVRR